MYSISNDLKNHLFPIVWPSIFIIVLLYNVLGVVAVHASTFPIFYGEEVIYRYVFIMGGKKIHRIVVYHWSQIGCIIGLNNWDLRKAD